MAQTTRLDGFDIDTSTRPTPQWLPPTTSIKEVPSYESDVPIYLHGFYEIIYTSNLAASINDSNAGNAVKNIIVIPSTLRATDTSIRRHPLTHMPCPQNQV